MTALDYSPPTDSDEDLLDDPDDPSTLALDDVSRRLRHLRHLYRELAEYDQLHAAELARLNAAHERHAGPIVRKIKHVEGVLREYAMRAYHDYGKTKVVTPNGTISASRPLLPVLTVRDDDVADWDRAAPLVERRPKIPIARLRALLAAAEQTGDVRRAVLCKDELVILDVGAELGRSFDPGETGVYVEKLPAPDDPWLLITGLSWSPAGDGGLGRTFTIEPA